MAAVCEINCRGVSAVGLCERCQRPFCESHRAVDRSSRARYRSMCSECLTAHEAAHKANSIARAQQQRADEEFIKSGAGARLLRGAGVAPVDVHALATTYQKRLLRAPRRLTAPTVFSKGWILGKLRWYVNPRTARSDWRYEECSTVLLESPSGPASKFETYLARVIPHAEIGGHFMPGPPRDGRDPALSGADQFVGRGNSDGERWSDIAELVRKLAQP